MTQGIVAKRRETMNVKTLGTVIILLGLIMAAYAGLQLYQIDKGAREESSAYGANDRWGTARFGQSMIRDNAKQAQKGPLTILGIGGLVTILGIGITAAAKKQNPS